MLRRLATLAAGVLLGLGLPVPARAATVACGPAADSPRCTVWMGRVAWVPDGDTLIVTVNGTKTARSIRLIGVQAMEQHTYSPRPANRTGECHALEATARVEHLVRAGGGVVRLTAQDARSTSRGRPLRSIAVRINGRWVDIGQDLIKRGYALWLPFAGEWAWDAAYARAQATASTRSTGMWNDHYCGTGPAASMTVWANTQGHEGEFVRIGNTGRRAVDLTGWWVRDSGLRRYTFRRGTVVPAGGHVYVHVGKGRDTVTDRYWGLNGQIFTNPDPARHALGDGAYLFDPQGDLRESFLYPCPLRCASPLTGKVTLRPENGAIALVNTGSAAVNLQGHMLVAERWQHRFDEKTLLQPGEALSFARRPTMRLQTADMWTVASYSDAGPGSPLRQ
ncbi:nuclease [Actinoplanes sp. SE50]|uniref:lamin tail domain-containing protein n=1 Tax=unclassified Actinoplanes TaxID=2626549 RepID=UPI00023EC6A5|nr:MULTISPECIES: lamin tail domain-containing protein [unclassified Actinoplanes]AEV86446.1 nuclease (SNase domain protein) [Actinoplanes sp. SE50/110]ATO84844.1 nuclease [Actinoplanes sp. SE50]SLM02253.1 nuclease [Actinoplanes sp. SE50/110]